MSGGLLRATPHYVRAPRKDRTQGVSRNTLAIFMQPRSDLPTKLHCAVVCVPKGRQDLGDVFWKVSQDTLVILIQSRSALPSLNALSI